jgi:prepilin-type N-terminal cleavage/methylation domain-containing protein
MTTAPPQPSKGFSLIELVMVIVLLSISTTGLIMLFGQLTNSLSINNDIQSAAQLAQECAEHLLGARRRSGYDLGGVTDCSALPAYNGFGPPSVTISDPYTGAACPAGASCKLLTIDATYDSGASTVTLLLTDY